MDHEQGPTRPRVGVQDLQILQTVRHRLFAIPSEPVRVSRYVLEEQVGQGALGTVWRANDPALGRKVAIKLFREGTTIPREHARSWMREEAAALAALSHPNVVAVYDVGPYRLERDGRVQDEVPTEGHYIAMEWIDGPTLRAWLERPQTERDIVAMFCDAGRGLMAAHSRGLVHRDFKPDNVLVAGRHAKVVDFGLAQLQQDDEGSLAGTPWTMAPEQHDARPVDARADQYAFCLCLWEALFGPAAPTLPLLLERKRAGDWTPPRRGVPRAIRRALMRGLSVDPNHRFDSMAPILDALTADPRARSRLALTLGFGCVVAAGAAVLHGDPPERAAQPIAGTVATDRDRLGIAAAMESGTLHTVEASCHRAMASREADPADHAWAAFCLGAIANGAGRCAEAQRWHHEAFEQAITHGFDQLASLSAARHAIASLRCGDADDVPSWIRHAEAARDRGGVQDPSVLAHLHLARASLHVQQGHEERALPEYRSAERLRREGLGASHRSVAKAMMLVGNSLQRLERGDEALAVQARAIEQLEASVGPQHLDVATALNDRATTLLSLRRPAEAEDALLRGLAIATSVAGPQHPTTAMLQHNLGLVYSRMGEHARALPHQQAAAASRETLHGEHHLKTLKSLNNVGLTLLQLGRLDEASDVLYDVLARHETIGPHPLQRMVLRNLIDLAVARGDEGAAEGHRARLEALQQTLGLDAD